MNEQQKSESYVKMKNSAGQEIVVSVKDLVDVCQTHISSLRCASFNNNFR